MSEVPLQVRAMGNGYNRLSQVPFCMPPSRRVCWDCPPKGQAFDYGELESIAHATHRATYFTPCRPLIRALSGWIQIPPPSQGPRALTWVGTKWASMLGMWYTGTSLVHDVVHGYLTRKKAFHPRILHAQQIYAQVPTKAPGGGGGVVGELPP